MSIAAHVILGIVASCWLYAMVTGQLQNNAPDAMYHNSRDAPRPIKIRQPGGRPVEMRCIGQAKPGQPQAKLHGVVWHYKECSKAHNMTPCNKFVDGKNLTQWETLTGETFSRSLVTLQKPTEKNNGLYRCTIKNKLHPKILTTYELDLVDKAETRPEIIVGPKNQTTRAGGRVSFQCQVLSKIEPTIRWFRKDDLRNIEPAIQWFMRNDRPNTTTTQFLKYFNDTYEPMPSDMIYQSQDKYLSKLILMSTAEWDAGLYVCLALNNVDFIYRGAYLNVIPSNTTSDDSSTLSLSWLFMIPAALALIPITVWLCCLWHRRKHSTKAPAEEVVQPQSNLRCKYKPVQKDNVYTMTHYNMPMQCNTPLQCSTPVMCGTPHCNTPVTSCDCR